MSDVLGLLLSHPGGTTPPGPPERAGGPLLRHPGGTTPPSPPDRPSGPVLFARYAFPPNQHGYCGPVDAAGFLRRGAAGDDEGLRAMAADFDGAWPFLRVIAEANGLADPLDREVVAAYWLGGSMLEAVEADSLPATVTAALSGRCGPMFSGLPEAVAAGASPHHSFAVLGVYPWVAMLGDERRTPRALTVLDRCRIRWGEVLELHSDHATVSSAPLRWAEGQLVLGEPVTETVRTAMDGLGLTSSMAVGDDVALHWDWVCDVITADERAALEHYSATQQQLANRWLAARAAAGVGHG